MTYTFQEICHIISWFKRCKKTSFSEAPSIVRIDNIEYDRVHVWLTASFLASSLLLFPPLFWVGLVQNSTGALVGDANTALFNPLRGGASIAWAWVKNKSFLNSLSVVARSARLCWVEGKLAAHSIIFGVSFFNPWCFSWDEWQQTQRQGTPRLFKYGQFSC